MVEESRYTFHLRHCDGTEITLTGNKETLPDILEDFRNFLLGCTFEGDTINRCFGEFGEDE